MRIVSRIFLDFPDSGVGGAVISTLTFYAGDQGFDSRIRQSYRSAIKAFAYAIFFDGLNEVGKRSRIFQEPLQYSCKSLGTGVTKYKYNTSLGTGTINANEYKKV